MYTSIINMKQSLVCASLLFIFLFSGKFSFAQAAFELPQNIELNAKEDYTKYEPVVVEAAKWLEATDLDKDAQKRQEINDFVLQWVSGSSTVSVDITPQLSKIYGKNTQLIGIYLASYSRNFIENRSTATKLTAAKAGIISMMNVYKKDIRIIKNKEMDKLIKFSDSELQAYVAEKFKL